MTTFDVTSHYFSGQGVVMLAERTALGKPKGLLPVGNVSDLRIAIAETVLEHKESQSGSRSIDKRISQETKCTLTMVMENYIAKNLAIALRAGVVEKAAGSVTGETPEIYFGKVIPLEHIKVSSVVVNQGATALTLYTDDDTPYDYKLNADAGSIEINDGSVVLTDKLSTEGTALTGVTVGATTTFTFAARPANAYVGGKAHVQGLTGADAAVLNAKAHTILSMTDTTLVVDTDTAGDTITVGTAECTVDGDSLDIDYSYEAQTRVDALTEGSSERYMRFEGLNTADDNLPVVVEVFKFQTDPLKELSLIGDGIGQFTLEGNVLADPLQTSGSKFFKKTLLR